MSTIGLPKILKNICELFGASITASLTMENEHWHLMNSMTPQYCGANGRGVTEQR